MSHRATYSVVLDLPVDQVWQTVRDFDSYPLWVDGVTESHIEDGLSGTAVGAVRDFAMGGGRTRQRLLAHSDAERYFTYESCTPLVIEEGTLHRYEGTLRLRRIADGERTFAEWSAEYDCPPADVEYWADWWSRSLPEWLDSLRRHFG